MEDDGDRRNSPPLPSTYVTLVQLQQRWLQEKQRKQREEEEREEQERKQRMQKEQEDEEKRKRREEEDQQRKQKQANLQKRPVQSTATFHRRDHRPPLKSSAQFRAVGVSDGESKRIDDLKQKEKYNEGKNWQMRGKPRAEEDLSGGKEQLLPEKEDVVDKIPVVSTERDYSEKERVTRKWKKWRDNKRGKARVEEDLAIGREHLSLGKEVEAAENDVVPVISTERRRCEKQIGGKCEEGVSASGGKRGNGRSRKGVKNRGNNKRVEEEDLINIGREEMLPKTKVEDENVVVVVSTERDGGGLEEGNGKNLVVNGDRVWQERVGGTVVDRPERVLGKFEGLSVRGGGYGRNAGNVNGAPRRHGQGYGSGNSWTLQRPRDSNLVWVRKEEGDTSDANVARV